MSSAAPGSPRNVHDAPSTVRPTRGADAPDRGRPRRRRLAAVLVGLVSVSGLLVSPAAPAVSEEPTAPRAAATVAAPSPRGDYGWPTGALGVVLEGAAGQGPAAGVGAADEQHAPLLVEPDQPFVGTVRLDALDYKHLDLKKFYPYGKNITYP